jgi:hypothetical protein
MTHNMHVWMTIWFFKKSKVQYTLQYFQPPFSQTSYGTCQPTPCNIPEEWRPKLDHGRNLKPHSLILDDGMLGSLIWSNKFIMGFFFLMTKADRHGPNLDFDIHNLFLLRDWSWTLQSRQCCFFSESQC